MQSNDDQLSVWRLNARFDPQLPIAVLGRLNTVLGQHDHDLSRCRCE